MFIENNFAKTKILATLGPTTSSIEKIKELVYAGVDGVRINLSHGSLDFIDSIIKTVKKAILEINHPLSILVDLQGPKIRIGELEQPEILLNRGSNIRITTENILGNSEILPVSYNNIQREAEIGNILLIDDGLIRIRIIEKLENELIGSVEVGGIVRPRKGLNLPGMRLSIPAITDKDKENLDFVMKYDIDYIALSFVRSANDIKELKELIRNKGTRIPVIAKIEKSEAIDCFDEILEVADGIMVARGDLGVEMEPQKVPVVQKYIINKCNQVGKLVITATQMLESMVNNPIPTRAEASDVANAVWDGTDVVMLSAETSVGKFPLETVHMMNNIIMTAENYYPESNKKEFRQPSNFYTKLFDSFCKGIVSIADSTNVKAIVVFTHQGRTALFLSKYKPKARIVAISDDLKTMNRIALKWGVTSLYSDKIKNSEEAIPEAVKLILASNNASKGDLLLFASAAPMTDKKRINWIKFVET